MTIGIGVLCSSRPKPHTPRPDSLILIADTMGSSDYDSTDELHKMWLDSELGVYAVGAGTLEYCGELFSIIQNEFKLLDQETLPDGHHHRTHGRINSALIKAFLHLKSQHFQWDIVWSKLGLPIIGNRSPEELANVQAEWQKFWIAAQMIIGAFDHEGQGYLYAVGQSPEENGQPSPKIVQLREFPGFATIGSGSYNADFWLKFRGQVLGLNVRQSAYHAYESKQMAAKAPTVNDSIEIAVIQPDCEVFHLTMERQEVDGCPVSLPELEALYEKYGPQKTVPMGFPNPSPSGKRKRTL